jgi:hypothetical protein
LDVALFIIVIVDFNMSANSASSIKIYNPGADPFTSPIALEVKVVARYFNLELRSISLSVDSEFGCSLFVEQSEIAMHCLNYLIAQLSHIRLKILGFPINILFFNFSLKGDRVE